MEYEPPGPAAAAVCTVKLEHAVASAVGADRVLHRLVFPDAALGKLQPELQHLRQILRRGFDHGGDVLFAETVDLHAIASEIVLHLHDRVGILQSGLFLHAGGQVIPGQLVNS